MSYGLSGWGLSGWGGTTILGPDDFVLLSATSINSETVELVFSHAIDIAASDALNPALYQMTENLLVYGVLQIDAVTLRLYTSAQRPVTYVVSVVPAASYFNTDATALVVNSASFTGTATELPLVVEGLDARTDCRGQRIYLSWTNPAGVDAVKIVRTKLHWPFDLTDDHTVVYSGAAITEYTDSGLDEQEFYYYLVLCSDDAGVTYDIAEESRTVALSIAVMDSKTDHIKKWLSRAELALDATEKSEGGGGGDLDKWLSVMGCWLNLMRGHIKAIGLMADDEKAPYGALLLKNKGKGVQPEGESYDFSVPRRTALSISFVVKRRGTCPGIIQAVRMFSLWDAQCVQFGYGGVYGAGPFRTWDGRSKADVGGGATVSFVNRRLIDTAKAWTVDQWAGGYAQDWLGNIAVVESNTATELTFLSPARVTTLNGAAAVGATVIPLTKTVGLYPGMRVQLESATVETDAEIAEIVSIVPNTSITVRRPITGSYVSGDHVGIAKSLLESEFVGNGVAVGSVMTDATANWVTHQWVGYGFIDSAGTKRTVVSNTNDSVTLDGAIVSGDYAIAYAFTGVTTFAGRVPELRYRVHSGDHYKLWEPTLDIELAGTYYDPYDRLWQGAGSTILGAWGSGDVGVYIVTEAPQAIGKASTASFNTIDLDPSQPAPTLNSLVGMYLNPNQNQAKLFKIVANTTTTVTVDRPIESLVISGQVYYVLTSRDAARYSRIVDRLNTEFSHMDIRAHVLFQ